MKTQARSSRTKPSKTRNVRTNTYTLSTAKTYLGRLVDKARKGERVYIPSGHERFILQVVPEIEPIPMRPPGYFKFDEEDIELRKKFAKVSVIPKVRPD